MADTLRNFQIMICEGCAASLRVRRGDLVTCHQCKRTPPKWRIALPLELTRADRKLLRGLRIVPEW